MTDLDPNIWKNPTLGSVNAGPFLPEIEAQATEDIAAKKDKREPRVAHYDGPTYPQLPSTETIPSNYEQISWDEPQAPKKAK